MSFVKSVIIHHDVRSWFLAGLLLIINPVGAEEVRLYDAPPSAEDVQQALFPELLPTPGKKTRSIHMLPSVATTPPVTPQTFNTATPDKSSEPKSSITEQRSNPSPRTPSTAIAVSIKFGSNSSEIGANQIALLDPIGQTMAADSSGKVKMIVEGHTDARGSPGHNRKLSLRRANAVKHYLVSRYGIDPNRLIAVGKGSSELLVAQNPNDERNRRIQFRRQ